MGKLGVGVGDDFPIDEGKPREAAPPGPGPDYEKEREEWQKRREEWRRQRDQWREKRRQWRDEWRRKRREFREEMRARYGSDFDDYEPWRWHADPHHIFRLLGILALIVVTIMIFSHIYILFGLIVLAGLYFAYRGGFDHFDYPHRGAPPRPNPPAPPADAPKA
jgi:hypothetical protein